MTRTDQKGVTVKKIESDKRGSPIEAACLVLAFAVILFIGASPAQAAQDHTFAGAFGAPGSGAGQLSLRAMKESFPHHAGSGVAVDNATGDIYVADTGNHRVDEFTPAGSFVRAFGWEVDAEHPEAKLQTCTTATGCQAGTAGSAPGQLSAPTYLAVDNDPSSPSFGELYVAGGDGVARQNEGQLLKVLNATGGTFTLTFEGETTEPIPYNASGRQISVALGRLPAIGFGNAAAGNLPEARIEFLRALGSANVPQLVAHGENLQGAGASVEVSTRFDGVSPVAETITKFSPAGSLVESWGESGQLSKTPTAATGNGKLTEGEAIGTGDFIAGSATITNLNTESGSFQVGQGIEGDNVGFNNYITAVGPGTITLAKPAEGPGKAAVLTTNNRFVTNLDTESGAFEENEEISGPGLPPGTSIERVGSGFLILTRPATAAGKGVSLTASYQLSQGLGTVTGIAADASGQLWITSISSSTFEFGPQGALIAIQSDNHAGPQPAGLAIDSSGRLLFSEGFGGIRRFDPVGGTLEGHLLAGPREVTGLTQTSGDLYADDRGAQILDVTSQCIPSGTGCVPSQEFGTGHLAEAAGIALAPEGTLYAADVGGGRIAVFAVSLEADIQPPTEVRSQSALLHGSVNPEGGEVARCFFQAGLSKAYGQNLACLNEAGEEVGTPAHPLTGKSPIALHAKLEGLKAGAAYHFRLRAVNASSEEIHSEDEEFETLVLPRIEAEEAIEVEAEEATLKAKVNPRGLAVTSCQIEYGTSTAYGNALPCEPLSLPAGASPVPVAAHLTGLSASTTYHWRVRATDENGAELSPDNTFVFLPGPPSAEVSQECSNQSLREANGSTALPDCRAYELVTPPHKNGALIGRYFGPGAAVAADGSRVFGASTQCFAGSESCNAVRATSATEFEFTRGTGGWVAHPITPPATEFSGASLWVLNPDQGTELFGLPVPNGSPEGREWFYARSASGSLTPIGPVLPGSGSYLNSSPRLSTPDVSHVVYGAHNFRWPFDQTQAVADSSLYEYAGSAEHPILVAVTGGPESTSLIGTCGAELRAPPGGVSSALSADGRTVYFVVQPCASGTGANLGEEVPAFTVYARIDGEGSAARTVKISGPAPEPQCGSSCQAQPPANAYFAGASSDGSRAYFLSTQQLTDSASEDSTSGDSAFTCDATVGKNGCNLYLYSDPQQQPQPTGDHLTAVSAGDTSGQGPQVQGVVAISPDGSRAYFVAKGLLAGQNAEGDSPLEGSDNLYVHDAVEETTHFIATLPGGSFESELWRNEGLANVTPDGRFLLFTSHGALTPDATREAGPAQVYRYDAQAEALTRVSIGRAGFDDNGNSGSGDATIVGSLERHGRSISADGTRVFFESPIGLTPGALDDVSVAGRGFAQNVYEWEEDGAGSCNEAAGCVYLISDGKDTAEGNGGIVTAIELAGTDASGEDVFFKTVDPLVPTDTDTEADIYDARALGGFAPPPHAVPCETSEQCHGEGTSEGPGSQPASNGFQGPEEGSGHPEMPKPHKHRNHRKHHKHHKQHHHRKRAASRNLGGGR